MCHRLLQILISRGSCSSSDGHLRPSVTSWLQPSTAGQSLGITGGTGGQVVSLCGTFLQSFLYICLQLWFKIAPRGLSVGLWEVRPKQHKQPRGTILKCWEFFSSQLEDSVVINLLLVIETVACSECLHLYQGFFAACVGERICSLFFLLSVERWCCSYNDPLGGTSVEKGTPRC